MDKLIKSICLLVYVLLIINSVSGQSINIKDGTSLKINEGTFVNLKNDTLLIQKASVTNNGEIIFFNSGFVKEQNLYPITGTGYEQITKSKLFAYENVGGLGLAFENSSLENLSIKRGHSDIFPDQKSINRWFETSPKIQLSSLSLKYDETEINGLNHLSLDIAVENNEDWNIYPSFIDNGIDFYSGNSLSVERITLVEGKSDIRIFPNPGNDLIYISNLPLSSELSVTMFTVEGKLLMENQFGSSSSNAFYISTSHLSKGVYFIEVKNNNQSILQQKWVKN